MNQTMKKLKYLIRFVPDKIYLGAYYYAKQKRRPNIKNPKRISEKNKWLKLYDKNPEHTISVDKYLANHMSQRFLKKNISFLH